MAVIASRRSPTRLLTSVRAVLSGAFRQHSSLTTDLIENMDKKETWDRFYRENNVKRDFKNFEWFFGFDSVQDFILPLLRPQPSCATIRRVLDLGCGTSALGPGIYKHSQWPVHVTCADISPVAVQLLQEQANSKPIQPGNPSSRLTFLELDCCRLQARFGEQSLDVIVDKGTTDALLRSREGQPKAGLVLKQCLGVLRQSGCLLQFSDEDPDARVLWLERESGLVARVGVQEVGTLRGVCYYCYMITPCAP
ncbi:citrate synthase-lysine N-methyltransferase CSKMT, mitochondrial isoform X1 [Anguilla anguilla]|uniref:citrate synthase-lysine N-methyltransferase CSKMT, mitochondrial isoform X1 n=1 Tax=Anguilla anguilla TaxID=7936 RepID=UPI0015ABF9E5|nr:citrate synthase-lysine N-methyltransferase CSKMT, mitochondrial isoform X1 [Anguilla anguilla]